MPERKIILPDTEARRAISEDLGTTFLVEAGAGSGKTRSLVERIVSLAASGVPMHQIAAVTFTRKAAAELKERFQERLEKAACTERNDAKKKSLARALEEIDRAFVGTIHSFCARLLRERPVEAGLDPDFVELDQQEADAFRDAFFWTYLEERVARGDEVVARLTALGLRLDDLLEPFCLLARYPEVAPVVDPAGPAPDFASERERVETFLDEAASAMPSFPPDKSWDDLQKKLKEAIPLARVPEAATPGGFAAVLLALESAVVIQNRWPPGAGKRIARSYEDLREEVIKPALARWRAWLYPHLMDLLGPASKALAERRKAEGKLSFDDLLLIARDLLRGHPAVRRYFQTRFTRLLVDEFQDTDPIQAELLLYLTGDHVDEPDYRRLRPVPGSLFVVGDPKQSIYRFRRADITTYQEFKKILRASGARVLRLTANFRSVPSVLAVANKAFETIFPGEDSPYQAAYAPLAPTRDEPSSGSGAFMLRTTSEGGERVKETVRENAGRVAAWIQAALRSRWSVPQEDDSGLTRPVRPDDFLVLTAGRDALPVYAENLQALGIPVELSGTRSFRESEELTLLRPFLRAADDPDDAVSLVAFLVGPLCGVDDAALHSFRRSGGRFSYAVPPPEDADPRIIRGLALLKDAHASTRRLPPAAALTRMADRLGLVALAMARELGETRAGNLLKILALARRLSSVGLSFRDIVVRLKQEALSPDVEELNIHAGARPAVRVMNIHRAKGLEAPIVVLAEPSNAGERTPELHVARGSEPPAGYFALTRKWGRTRRALALPPDWEARCAEETKFEKAEAERRLYVAATRAMSTLVVSVHHRSTKSSGDHWDGPWAPLREHLAELPFPSFPLELAPEEPAPSLAELLTLARGQIAGRLETCSRPTLSVSRVTKVAKEGAPRLPAVTEDAHGTAWGRILHRLLELAMRDATLDLALIASRLVAEEGLPLATSAAVLDLVAGVRSSELWTRALAAKRRFVEVPFEVMTKSSSLGLGEGPEETLLKGTIDLVFQEEGIWRIVDYKSDVVGGNRDALVAHYAPQVAVYRRYWELLTNEPAHAGLYFIDTGELVWTDAPPLVSTPAAPLGPQGQLSLFAE